MTHPLTIEEQIRNLDRFAGDHLKIAAMLMATESNALGVLNASVGNAAICLAGVLLRHAAPERAEFVDEHADLVREVGPHLEEPARVRCLELVGERLGVAFVMWGPDRRTAVEWIAEQLDLVRWLASKVGFHVPNELEAMARNFR